MKMNSLEPTPHKHSEHHGGEGDAEQPHAGVNILPHGRILPGLDGWEAIKAETTLCTAHQRANGGRRDS